MESDEKAKEKVIKKLISYIGIISWLIHGINETIEQDKNLNLFLSEKDIKKISSNKN